MENRLDQVKTISKNVSDSEQELEPMNGRSFCDVSVIIPAFNAGLYIDEAITSALNQTVHCKEVIVIDDGSTDNTSEIVASFGSKVRYRLTRNTGPGSARNTAARMATGKWLAFLDADDVWLPRKLEKQMELSGNESELVYCDRLNFGRIEGLSEKQSDSVFLATGNIFLDLLLRGNCITLSSAIISDRLFKSVGGFSEDPRIGGVADWELWLRASRLTSVACVHEPLVKYRCHSAGISKNIDKMFFGQELVLNKILQNVDEKVHWQARSSSASISGFFAKNQKQFLIAAKYFLRAIRFAPLNSRNYKELFKCLIRRI